MKVYAWELPRVVGNACNGLTPTVALQLAAVVYGANLFSEPLEDLNAAWLLECLRTLILAWHCNEFVADLFLQCKGVYDHVWMMFDASANMLEDSMEVAAMAMQRFGGELEVLLQRPNANAEDLIDRQEHESAMKTQEQNSRAAVAVTGDSNFWK
eukprot:Gb_31903 [translate_table: standard]